MALALENIDVWIGTALGTLKGASTKRKGDISYRHPIPVELDKFDRPYEIKTMCWDSGPEKNLLLGHKNGRVSSFSTSNGQFIAGCEVRGAEQPGVLVALEKHGRTLISCLDNGTLSFWPEEDDKLEVSVGKDVSCMKGNPHIELQVATGGKENDLKLWDGNNLDHPVFQAKNVPPDHLQLRVPVWVTQICFVPPVQSSSLVAIGTGYHHIRLYDIRAQRRPVHTNQFGDSPITAMDTVPNGRDVVIGNSKGQIAKLDLRSEKVVNTFKDGAGCVKCVRCSSEEPLLVSCGLDRFLRVYHLESRKMLQKEYLKLEMNCLLLSSVAVGPKPDEGKVAETDVREECQVQSEDNNSSGEEDIWDRLEIVTESSLSKKRSAVKVKSTSLEKKRRIAAKKT